MIFGDVRLQRYIASAERIKLKRMNTIVVSLRRLQHGHSHHATKTKVTDELQMK